MELSKPSTRREIELGVTKKTPDHIESPQYILSINPEIYRITTIKYGSSQNSIQQKSSRGKAIQ